MNLPRIFANAIARRVAYLVVVALLAAISTLFGMSDAHAQNYAACYIDTTASATCPDRGTAYEQVLLVVERNCASYDPSKTICTVDSPVHITSPSPGYQGRRKTRPASGGAESVVPVGARYYTSECPPGQTWDDDLKVCSECAAGEQTPTFPSMLNVYRCPTGQCPQLGTMCNASGPMPNYVCWTNVGGSRCSGNEPCPTGYSKDPNSGLCLPPEECPEGTIKDANGNCLPPAECPEGTVKDQFGLCKPKDNECPAGQIKSPEGNCLPGEGQCSAGHVRGSDGTCKKDSDGNGEPDEDEDKDGDGEKDGPGDKSEFSGGENCNAPPVCTGDNILCGQARIQWRIDCNTRKNATIAGGQCGAPPQCTGDGCKQLDSAILLTTWRTACALENRLDSVTGDGTQPEWTKVAGMSQNPGEGQTEGDTAGVTAVEWSPESMDGSGWIGGSAIGIGPGAGGALASGYLSVLANPPAIWIEYIVWIKAILIALTALACAFFLARG